MSYTPGSVRLWASATDWLDLAFCGLGVGTNNPDYRVADRRGRIHVIKAGDDAGRQRWSNRLTLRVPAAQIHRLNSLEDRSWADWLLYWLDEQNATLLLYARTKGTDSEGNAISLERWYTADFAGTLPEWLRGLRNSESGAERRLELAFIASDEGTLHDWDEHDVDFEFPITAASTALDQFTISGDYSARFSLHTQFRVAGSTGNDATYSCASNATPSGGNTIIQVATVPDGTADGSIWLPNLRTRGDRGT